MKNAVTLHALITLYFALLYPFLIYGVLICGDAYPTNIKPFLILQKRTIRLIPLPNMNILVHWHINIFRSRYPPYSLVCV